MHANSFDRVVLKYNCAPIIVSTYVLNWTINIYLDLELGIIVYLSTYLMFMRTIVRDW